MNSGKNTAVGLLKSIAANTKSPRARAESIESVYRMSPEGSREWLLEISADLDRRDPSTDLCLLRLLPDLAMRDAAASAGIFCNLLGPDSNTGLSGQGAELSPKQGAGAAGEGAEIAGDLLSKAPREFSKAILDITLKNLGMTPPADRTYTVDVRVSPWYFSRERSGGALLDQMEAKLAEWHDAGDGRANSILDVLWSESHSLAKLVLLEALARDPARHVRRILDTLKSAIGVSDLDSALGRYAQKVLPVCTSAQVQEFNGALLNARLSRDPGAESKRRRSMLLAIPERFRTAETRNWLGAESPAPAPACRTPPSRALAESGDGAWANPQDAGEALDMWAFADDAKKTDLLMHIGRFLEAGTLKREHSERLEKTLRSCLLDGGNPERPYTGSHVRERLERDAALCQMLLTSQNASPGNISTCRALSTHDNAWVRASVAKGLAGLSDADFKASFAIAQRLAKDIPPVPAYLDNYMYSITNRHALESLQLCRLLVETRGRDADTPYQDRALSAAVSVTARMALQNRDREFSRLFDSLVRDDSYNYAVKHRIAFFCRPDRVLHDDSLLDEIIGIYSNLLDSHDPHVRGDAEFFLLHPIAQGDRHFFPRLKPVLEKASRMIYEVSSNPTGMALVDYLGKFWKEIPQESVAYLGQLCRNNPPMTIRDPRASSILDVMESMFESGLLDSKSKQDLLGTLMLFVDAGWSRANLVLDTAERHL